MPCIIYTFDVQFWACWMYYLRMRLFPFSSHMVYSHPIFSEFGVRYKVHFSYSIYASICFLGSWWFCNKKVSSSKGSGCGQSFNNVVEIPKMEEKLCTKWVHFTYWDFKRDITQQDVLTRCRQIRTPHCCCFWWQTYAEQTRRSWRVQTYGFCW